ncbi:MAG: hypothetical protein JNK00_03415 [Flavipsychrobacter sp.]|nr:hypothetical protein [Flavipsychrobacter sp.]
MKKLTLLIVLIALSASSFAQRGGYKGGKGRNNYECPKLYIGITAGIESPGGLIGFNVDVPVTQKFSLSGSAGLGSWGYKAGGEGRFYFGECNRSWALGAGVTYNTGLKNFSSTMPTTMGDANVAMDLNPKTNVFIAAHKFFNLGRNGHRFNISMGYSIRLDEDNYRILNGYTLTSEGKQVMTILAPGGFMLGFGFTFGVLR